jgi:hypothetical protein
MNGLLMIDGSVCNHRPDGASPQVMEDEVAKANPGFSALVARFPWRSTGLGGGDIRRRRNVLDPLRLCALSAAVAGLLTFSCCGTYATLHLAAPSSAVEGSPFTITVSATIGTSPDKIINSPVRFSSSDSAAILPPVYYFNANDAGSHTFTDGVTLMTAGSQSITATVIGASGLTATANVTVSATSAAAQFKASAP